jgi:hypothetical protein
MRGLASALNQIASLKPEEADSLLEATVKQLQEALRLRPGDPLTLTLLGDVYYSQSKAAKATDAKWSLLGQASHQYAPAVEALPDHFPALYGSGLSDAAIINTRL